MFLLTCRRRVMFGRSPRIIVLEFFKMGDLYFFFFIEPYSDACDWLSVKA